MVLFKPKDVLALSLIFTFMYLLFISIAILANTNSHIVATMISVIFSNEQSPSRLDCTDNNFMLIII